MIRVGVVGVGFGQRVHVPALRHDGRFEVIAIAASNLCRAQEAAARLGISKAFGGWREMLESNDIDALSIVTPPRLQPEIAVTALNLGKAVLCEKPLAASLPAAREMCAAAEHSGMANMVNFEFPEITEWRSAKSMIDNGAIGALKHLAITWNVETYANRTNEDSWKTRAQDGGGTLSNFVSHTLMYLEWMAGPLRAVSAQLFGARDEQLAGDRFVVLALQFESGAAGSVSVSADAFPGSGHRLEFYGDKGALLLENNTRDYVNGFRLLHGTRESGRMEVISQSQEDRSIDGRVSATAEIVSRFGDWIEKGIVSKPTFRDGLRVQELLDAAQRSCASLGRLETVRGTFASWV